MSEKVQAEIDKYIKTQTDLFAAIQKTADTLISPGKIEYTAPSSAQTISALNNNRLAQEKFLKEYQSQYDTITSLRQKYAIELDETNKVLAEQTQELSELENEKKQVSIGASTEFRRLKTEKYNQAKQEYYYHLYLVCGVILLVVVGVLVIAKLGFIPRATALVVFLVGVVGLGTYVVYYIFFNSRARDIMVFDRFRFPVNGDGLLACPASSDNKSSSKNGDLDAKVAGLLTDNAGTCPNKLVPDAEMPKLPTNQ